MKELTNVEKELLQKIKDLKEFCLEHGYPLAEILEEEETYYMLELL
jgi:hypothetical protein